MRKAGDAMKSAIQLWGVSVARCLEHCTSVLLPVVITSRRSRQGWQIPLFSVGDRFC